MKRSIKITAFWLFLPVLFAFILFSGCGKPKLAKPSSLYIDAIELTLNWNAVTDAAYYTIRIEGDDKTAEADSSKNYYELKNLAEGSYTLSVKAISGSNENYSDSSWSEKITFVRQAETGLSFRLTDSNTAFEVIGMGTAEGDVAIPDTYRGLPVTKIADGAFYNKNLLTSVVIGKNVTQIGAQAFANCSLLTGVTLPEGLESIGEKAFQSCRALESAVAIPDSVTEIGAQAFEYCRKLPSVTLGKGLTSVPENAFNGCNAITSLTIPDNITTLGEGAFSACSSLSSVEMGEGLTEIGVDAFRKCTSLASVTLGKNVESIGDYAFAECTALESATLGNSLKTIGVQAFYGCTNLSQAEMGNGIEKISRQAFSLTALWKENEANYLGGWFLGTDSEEAPDIRDGTVGIADYAFENCKEFKNLITLPDSVKYIGEAAFKGGETINNVVIGGGVVSIGDSAFENSGLSLIVLGARDDDAEGMLGSSSLRSIGEYAFRNCAALNEIAIPESVERVGMYAFEDSAIWKNSDRVVYADNWFVGYKDDGSVGSITVRDGTAGIAEYALYNQQKITGITIPDSVKHIGRSAFYKCTDLTYAVIPNGLEVIEDYTFYHCDSLNLPKLPDSLKKIGRSAFYMCALGSASSDTSSDQLVIPDSVTEIGDYAFYGCGFTYEDPDQTAESGQIMKNGGIDAVVIGDGVTTIGKQAFAGIKSLKSAVIGDNVKTIGEKAFYKCEELADVAFGKNVKTIGARAFYGCSDLVSVNLPVSVDVIGDYAFYKCSSLKHISLGSVQAIGNYTFFGCTSLEYVSLPSTVTSIGKQAFRNCSSLESIFLSSEIKEIDAHAFYGCNALTVYAGAISQPEGWNLRWNSSYRPVVWGAAADDDGYIVSVTITDEGISNINFSYTLSAPAREGYVFGGWATGLNGEAVYSLEEIATVAAGTTLYAVWTAE